MSKSAYLETYREDLRALFTVLGERFLEDEDALVRWMEMHWLGSEHGPGNRKPIYTAEQVAGTWDLLDKLGLLSEVRPSWPSYDEILVFGAAAIGIYRRLGLVRESGVSAPLVSVLAGQRPHQRHSRDGSVEEYLEAEGRFAAVGGWQADPDQVAAANALLGAGTSKIDAAAELYPSETDMARALMRKHWPSLRSTGLDAPTSPQEVTNELGVRQYAWEHFEQPGPLPRMRLLNAEPVARSGGPARPTSRSSLREWVDSLEGVPQRLLAVVNQPHLGRVALDIDEVLDAHGIRVRTIEVVGRSVLRESVDVNLVLGEIPARINAERRRS